MRINFEQWIARIQAKPEHIRMRYVIGCAAFAMLLVLGVWSLSVSESFRTLSSGSIQSAKEVQGLLPKASNFSLDALLSGEKSLEERKKEVSGELFFQQQLDTKDQPNFKEDGYIPVESTESDTSQESGSTAR